jgi:hypothetical protein
VRLATSTRKPRTKALNDGQLDLGEESNVLGERDRTRHDELSSLVRKAIPVFVEQFPELGFLHIPSFLQELKRLEEEQPESSQTGQNGRPSHANCSTRLKALGSSLLALCAPFIPDDYDREIYAEFARSSISAADFPDRYTVQTLLVLGMYEWGNGRAYRAWIYTGQLSANGPYSPSESEWKNITCRD